MAWNDLAPNQMVSFIDIQGGGFKLKPGKTSINSNQCITKDEALDMYNVNPLALSSYTRNQLIPKSSLTGSGYNIVLCYDGTSSANACNQCFSLTEITLCYDGTSSTNACSQCIAPPSYPFTLCYDGTSSVSACIQCE